MSDTFWTGFDKQAGLTSILKTHQAESFIKNQAKEGIGFIPGLGLEVAKKFGLKKKTVIKLIKKVQRPALEADTVLGHYADKAMNKLPKGWPGKKLFKMPEEARVGHKLYEKYDRPSIVAPLHKTMEIAKPIIVAGAIGKTIDEHKKRKNEQQY